MTWTPFTKDHPTACISFVEIMRRMDHNYLGLTVDHLRDWLKSEDYAAYKCADTDGEVVAVMLGKWRGPLHCPDIRMLGWYPGLVGEEGYMADRVIKQGDVLLQDMIKNHANQSKSPPRMVRCIIPKAMDYLPITRLHKLICDELRNAGRVVKEFDVPDALVCYFRGP